MSDFQPENFSLGVKVAEGDGEDKFKTSLLDYTFHITLMLICRVIQPTLLKEYYEIVGESRPLSAFFPKQADFVTEMHS